MQLDNYYRRSNLVLCIMLCLVPILGLIPLGASNKSVVNDIENFQSIWLLFGLFFTWFYSRPKTLPEGMSNFWKWAVLWWLVLFGRGISWGRVYFRHHNHFVFHAIAVVLIGSLLVMFFRQKELRREVRYKLTHNEIPYWTLFLTILGFLGSDCVEHHRLLSPLLLLRPENEDFVEEMFELPMMLGLFLITFGMMRHDKAAVASASQAGESLPEYRLATLS
ncbi:hypothetical protein TUM12370_22680 [Salmonella enterica subsp. enterica serovar Choleraesuis]|nr:hypothetical protein TUM12370_22680 [Salmonella enterica subsp. enterica serovar Choleraesuis]